MSDKKINKWLLERYILVELPEHQIKEIDRQLNQDPVLRKKLEQLRNSNREILDQYPPASVVPQILNRYKAETFNKTKTQAEETGTSAKSVFFKRLLYVTPAFAAALLLIFFIIPFYRNYVAPGKTTPVTESTGTRIKGASPQNLMIYRKSNDQIELLKNGTQAKAGDLLQVAYAAAEAVHGVILSIDGNGVVTLHFPEQVKGSTRLNKKKKKILLQNAYELDDAPGFERFFFITSKSKIDVQQVIKKARTLAKDTERARTHNIDLGGSFRQVSILIIKGGK
ncbi:MAG: hypothetical protein GTO45_36840 [Candidatus Aminicenantes bacterium]|nr:hypothetical protein [Candidatus Aminicenantes bacterium]NIM78214.1 hypothetical protein [Candidatus Aminicenantes bacterium]NIN23720.1 hypothetical protein [Candidatus Aminicenantes bacterium]NIN47427.1 hypothetical protein [Candidatus Aminicenantes bacterium]NIN90355.1 hypothetical protein [Candidatus Aminicenantes bacterium]